MTASKRIARPILLLLGIASGACEGRSLTDASSALPQALASMSNQDDRASDTDLQRWSALSDSALWVAVSSRDSLAMVGLKLPGTKRGVVAATRLIDEAATNSLTRTVTSRAGISLRGADKVLPRVIVHIGSEAALVSLRSQP